MVGVVVFIAVCHRLFLHAGELRLAWTSVSWPLMVLSFALLLGANLLFSLAWHNLLGDYRDGPGDRRGDVARWLATLAAKYLPGKIWQGVARVGLYHRDSVQAAIAPAYLREMLLTVSAALSVVSLQSWGDARFSLLEVGALGTGAVLAFLASLPSLSNRAVRMLLRIRPAAGAWVAAVPKHGATGAGAWAMQLCAYLLLGLGLVAAAKAALIFPAEAILPMVAGLCFAGVAGIAAIFVPAGLGVREAALAWYLTPYVGAGNALAVAVLGRVWLTVGEACLIALGLGLLHRQRATSGQPTGTMAAPLDAAPPKD